MGRRWWAGPGLGRPGPASPVRPSISYIMGRGLARPIKFQLGGPRPGPARRIFRGWAAARPGPSNFQRMGRGPAQPITFSKIHGPARPIIFPKVSARPGPAHHMAARPMRHGLYMGRPDNYVRRPVDFDGPAHEPAHVLSRTKRCMCIR